MVPELLARMCGSMWMLDGRTEAAIDALIARVQAGGAPPVTDDDVLAAVGAAHYAGKIQAASLAVEGTGAPYQVAGGVAVINVWGVLDKTDADVTSFWGRRIGTSYESIAANLAHAQANESVSSILLNIDSPGGAARPIEPFADRIFAAAENGRKMAGKGGKPVYALANDLMASAALFLGVQADKVYATPGAWVGSIGTRLATLDISAFLEREGVKVNMIKSGEFKDLGSPYRPMSEQDRAKLQSECNEYFAAFKAAVVRGRRMDAAKVDAIATGEGFIGKRAMDAGLVDGMRPGLGSLVAEMNAAFPAKARGASVVMVSTQAGAAGDTSGAAGRSTDMDGTRTGPAALLHNAAGGTTAVGGGDGGGGGAAPANGGTVNPDTGAISLAAERKRVSGIMAVCSAAMAIAGVADLQQAAIADPNATAETIAPKLTKLLVDAKPPTGDVVQVGAEQRQKEQDAFSLAMFMKGTPQLAQLVRGGGDTAARMAAALNFETAAQMVTAMRVVEASGFRGMSLKEIAAHRLEAAGIKAPLGNVEKLYAAAVGHSSSDFPLLLENALHKTLLGGFEEQEYSWSQWCAVGSASDFKPQNQYRMSEAGDMELLPEGKVPDEQTFGERREQISLSTYGARCSFTLQMFANDDMGAFTRIPALFGNSFARVPETLAIALLTTGGGTGPTMSDGVTLWHEASHANTASAAALTVATAQTAITAIRTQRAFGADGKTKNGPYLNLNPGLILTGPTLSWQAKLLFESQYDPKSDNTNANRPNTVRGMLRPLVSPLITSATAYYVIVTPSGPRLVQVNFFNGQRTPTVTRVGDGSTLKNTWEFIGHCGAAAVDHEAGYYNAGA